MYFTISYQETTDVSEYCEANKKIFAKYAELTVKVIRFYIYKHYKIKQGVPSKNILEHPISVSRIFSVRQLQNLFILT